MSCFPSIVRANTQRHRAATSDAPRTFSHLTAATVRPIRNMGCILSSCAVVSLITPSVSTAVTCEAVEQGGGTVGLSAACQYPRSCEFLQRYFKRCFLGNTWRLNVGRKSSERADPARCSRLILLQIRVWNRGAELLFLTLFSAHIRLPQGPSHKQPDSSRLTLGSTFSLPQVALDHVPNKSSS
jgi:hypothetical protein